MSVTTSRPISEAALQQTIVEACDVLQLPWFHIRNSRGNPGVGYPDLTIADWRNGVLRMWELKTEKNTTSAKQEMWLEALTMCQTVDVQVVRPGQLDWALGELGR